APLNSFVRPPRMTLRYLNEDENSLDAEATVADIESLMRQLQLGTLSVGDFCSSFERMWNFEVRKDVIPAEIFEPLDALFDEVVWYSPAPMDQWEYPKYRDDSEVREAVAIAQLAVVPKR
ncbi:hypothetical protein, partial [Pelomonas sp. KK5]|uniref:hypothetical protein n=1 Tax=Pelomonas sp. KK5 TaxID=1855730 RepID=UPI001E46D364